MQILDLWRRRGTLWTQLLTGLAFSALFVVIAGAIFTRQLFVLNDAIGVMQQEMSRLQLVLAIPSEVADVQLQIQRYAARENAALFAERVGPPVALLQQREEMLQEQLSTMAAGETMRNEIARTVVGLQSAIGIAEHALTLAQDNDWAAVEAQARSIDLPRGQVQEAVQELDILAQQQYEEAGNQVRRAQRQMILAALLVTLVLVVSAVISMRLIRSVGQRVGELGAAAQRLASGRFKERVEITQEDELGQLGGVFNAMAEELLSLYTNLEEQVVERTRALERRSTQLETAAQVGREAAEIRDITELLNTTVRLISERFGFYHAGIFLIDDAGEYAVLQAASSEGGQRMLARGHKLQVGQVGIVGYATGIGEPRIALDVGEDAVFFNNPDLPDTRSEMALPLKVRERVIGALDVQSTAESAFTREDVAILGILADQIAIAIENANLLEEAEDRVREISGLLSRYGLEEWQQLVEERQAWGYVYDGVKVIPKEQDPRPGLPSMLTLPLRVREESIGQISLTMPERAMTREEINLAQDVANQVGLVIENARLFEETQRTLREMEALYAANRRLTTATTVQQVADAITECISETEADMCVVVQFEYSSTGEPVALSYLGTWRRDRAPSFQKGLRLPIEQSPFPFELVSTFWTVDDVDADTSLPESARKVFQSTGVQAAANIPLHSRDRIIGQVVVLRTEPGAFASSAIRLYEMLSDQAAVALERAQLLEETQRRAEYQRRIAEITSRVRDSINVETILHTAIRELGQTLRAKEGLIWLKTGDEQSLPQTEPLSDGEN